MAAAPWRSRPVFLMSTFSDMQAERDHLQRVVFPALQERLRERRHHLEPIDLRWGVETVAVDQQHAKELLVLKVCLNEITRSRPFLIGLLGDRYGWVPPEERMRAAIDEQGFATEVVGKSVTALEIEFGVLASTDQKRRSHFYFRAPLPYDRMPPALASRYSEVHNPAADAAQDAQRLRVLKERIERDPTLADRVHHYRADWDTRREQVTGLEAWGRQVLEHLWQDLDEETREFVRLPLPTWQQQEQATLEEFVENRSRGFVGRGGVIEDLSLVATSPAEETLGWGVCVTGSSGSGKSALFAQLYRQWEGRDDVLLLAHAAGISPRASHVESMLRRWVGQLAQAMRERDQLPESAKIHDVEETFRALLSRASQRRRVVLLIDALNQFEPTPRGEHVTWLPKLWPDNARLIATTISGTQSQALEQRPGVRLCPLPLLNASEAEHIAEAVCQRYHRRLSRQVQQALLMKERPDHTLAAGIPLWLELALEELNLLDADDFARAENKYEGTAEERLQQMIVDVASDLPAGVEELYGYMLERAEQVAGWNWALAFTALVGVTRHGLRETDLRQLLPAMTSEPWDDLRFAVLRRTFRAHLVQRGQQGEWDFFHAQMRAAITRQYFNEGISPQNTHALIVDHLERLPSTDPMRVRERMHHLIGSDDQLRTARYYAGLPIGEEERAVATVTLGAHIMGGMSADGNPALEWSLALLEIDGLEDHERGMLCNCFDLDLFEALQQEANLTTQLAVPQRTRRVLEKLRAQDPVNICWHWLLSASLDRIGDLQTAQGDLTAALASYRESFVSRQRRLAADPDNADWQHDLSYSHLRLGDVQRAQGDVTAALASYRASLAISQQLVAADPNHPEWQRDLSLGHIKLGDVQSAQGDLTAALASFRAGLTIAQRLSATDPGSGRWQRDLSVSHVKLGDVQGAQGDLTAALASYRASLTILQRLAAANPVNVGAQNDLSVAHNRMGYVQCAQGDLTAALASYRACLSISQRLAAADPGNTGWQRGLSTSLGNLGNVQRAFGDLTAALASHRASLTIIERLAAADPSNAGRQSDLSVSLCNLGDVQSAQGELTAALATYGASLTVTERLAAADPGNAEWQSSLVVLHNKLASVQQQRHDAVAHTEELRECHIVLCRMRRARMFLEPPLEQLLQGLDQQFGTR